jgi:rhodanese-related sulfurtransferase
MQVIDFRAADEYTNMSLPKSTSFIIDNLFEKEPNNLLSMKHKINVFIADDELSAKKLAIIAAELGYSRIKILEGGLNSFKEQILDHQPIDNPVSIDEEYRNRFRTKAKEIIPILIKNNKSSGPVKKVQKRVIGGC